MFLTRIERNSSNRILMARWVPVFFCLFPVAANLFQELLIMVKAYWLISAFLNSNSFRILFLLSVFSVVILFTIRLYLIIKKVLLGLVNNDKSSS
jgi:hypothetical protein